MPTSGSRIKLTITIGQDGWDGMVSENSGASARRAGNLVQAIEGKSWCSLWYPTYFSSAVATVQRYECSAIRTHIIGQDVEWSVIRVGFLV